MSDSEKEDEVLRSSGKVQLVVTFVQDKEVETNFVVKPTTLLGKVFSAYEKIKGVEPNTYVFLYAADKLGKDQTPKMAGMEVGRTYKIEANLHMEGGGAKLERLCCGGLRG